MLAIVHAVGSPDPTRSHFEAQDFMESGTPGVKSTGDGWLNRTLGSLPEDKSAFRAIAMGSSMPRILSGIEPAVAMNHIPDFGVGGSNPKAVPIASTFESMYAHSVDTVLHGTGRAVEARARPLGGETAAAASRHRRVPPRSRLERIVAGEITWL